MIPPKHQDLIETSVYRTFSNRINLFQDKSALRLEESIMIPNITNNQRKFIDEKNKYFFEEFKKIFTKNILLRKRLNELLLCKKELHQQIIKLQQKTKNTKNKSKSEEKEKNNDNSKSKIKLPFFEIANPYFKKKRKRRRKSELISKHNCFYPNCNKSYPTKSSLNMHIKLKHLPQKSSFFYDSNNNK